MPSPTLPIPSLDAAWIEQRIYVVRGVKVMLDADLATLYEVPTSRLNEQVRRNRRRFPGDFLLELTLPEVANLKSQFAVSSSGGHGGRRNAVLAFTGQGVAMLSRVLRSDRAIEVNIAIIRTFVHLRQLMLGHAELAKRIDELEQRYDGQFQVVFDALRELTRLPEDPPRLRVGFSD